MVNKVIADYLKSGKRLVIPQFGAFIRKDTDGGVVFVPFLKKDDGVLAAQLTTAYGLSNEEAYGVITEYVAQVQRSVIDRGSFVVEGVGRLRIDSNGVCYLEADSHAGIDDTQPQSAPVSKPVAPVATQSSQSMPTPSVGAQSSATQNTINRPVHAQSASDQTPLSGRPASTTPSSQQVQQSQPQQPIRQGGGSQFQDHSAPSQQPYRGTTPYAPQGAAGPISPNSMGGRMPVQQRGTDKFLVVAIIAAVIALGAIIYGVVTTSVGAPEIEPMEVISHQRPAILDSIQKQDSIKAAETAAKTTKTTSKR